LKDPKTLGCNVDKISKIKMALIMSQTKSNKVHPFNLQQS
jgi:hypothetical protein